MNGFIAAMAEVTFTIITANMMVKKGIKTSI
jgi:hypothetical protein